MSFYLAHNCQFSNTHASSKYCYILACTFMAVKTLLDPNNFIKCMPVLLLAVMHITQLGYIILYRSVQNFGYAWGGQIIFI